MPVPASDAIASDVGHGALGIRSGLRPFRDLLSETVGQRHLWVELRPKKVLAIWTSEGSGVYSKAVAETFDGVVLDVVGVQTLTETLTRADKPPGTGGTGLAAGLYQYDGATLYIHLTADANPSGTTVVAQLGIHIGSHGVHQPVLGPDRLANGNLEAWTGANPDGWGIGSNVTAGTITVDKTTSDPLQGSYAARFTFTAATGYKLLRQDFTALLVGGIYRLSGAYRVSSSANDLRAVIYMWDVGSSYLQPDGRNVGGVASVFGDVVGLGEWRRFSYDFICPGWATLRLELKGETVSGTPTGTIDWDDVKLQLISRYAYHEPLLSIESLPTIEAARSDSFWGEMSSALGSLSLLNGNGYLEPLLASYDWLGADAIVRVGGRYQLGGNEVLMDDCPIIATGKLGAPTVTDSQVTFELQDDRNVLLRTLPTRTYNNNGGTDAYTQPDRGRVRPLLWGAKTGIRPVQYDIDNSSGGPIPMGKYEVVDCTDWPTGIKEITKVFWYVDDSAALVRSSARRTGADAAGSDYSDSVSVALTTGRFTILRDLHPFLITQENNKLVFDVGGAALTAIISLGTYRMYDSLAISGSVGLVKAIQTAMVGVDGADVGCSIVGSTQKVRISKGAGTLNLLCATGADIQTNLWATLGFNASTDKTGALIYDADDVYPLEAFDQVIRVDTIGFKDDGSGTYTGTVGAAIEKAPDIARFILRVLLQVPASAVDVASFVAARIGAGTKPCSLYIGSPRTVADVFEELETSGNVDLVLKGGVWYCYPRDTSVPAGTPDLVDADFLSFESYYNPEDLYGTVTLIYNESPDGQGPIQGGNYPWSPHARTETGEVTDATIGLRYDRPDQKTFKTCLRDKADAAYPLSGSRLEAIAAQCSAKRRRFRFATKGKALQVAVNGKIRLTRSRGLDATGALSNVLVRVVSKRDDWARWVSDVEAIEVV